MGNLLQGDNKGTRLAVMSWERQQEPRLHSDPRSLLVAAADFPGACRPVLCPWSDGGGTQLKARKAGLGSAGEAWSCWALGVAGAAAAEHWFRELLKSPLNTRAQSGLELSRGYPHHCAHGPVCAR